jgi:tellurite resistance protein
MAAIDPLVVARPIDPAAVARLVQIVTEDAIFCFAAAGDDLPGALEGLGKRRAEAYAGALRDAQLPRMLAQYDAWVTASSRLLAPLSPPLWLPMMGVIAEKVTLEIGSRGLRSLFSSRPSEKEVQRVKRLGALASRALRAVLSSDGELDPEESLMLGAFIASLGLDDADAQILFNEGSTDPWGIAPHGEGEAPVARAIVRGAWLAAAWDTLDPREELAIRAIASNLRIDTEEFEEGRASAQKFVDARRLVGLAAVEGVRYVLSDREPGIGIQLAAAIGRLLLPRRYREEALAHIGHGVPVVLGRRHTGISGADKVVVLGIVWLAALFDDPTQSRKAVLRSRFDRVCDDMGVDGGKVRDIAGTFVTDSVLLALKPFC